MGANQSSRKITVVNDEATGVIKISDSVAQRLKGEISKEKSSSEEAASPPPPPPPAPTTPVTAPPPPPPATAVSEPPHPSPQTDNSQQNGQHWQRPIIQYIEEPSISSLRVKQEKEEEMRKLEEYWQNRLIKQQEEHAANAKLSEEELLKGIKKVESLFTPSGNKGSCRLESDAVKDCYKANPSQTLRCREVVRNFVGCVSNGSPPTAV